MDIHKLEIFVDLSETLNYTETAERQFTTQGNISKQIISLEKDLGVVLFERSHRKIELTKAGALALPYARQLITDYYVLLNKLSEYQSEQNLSLVLYTLPTMSNYRTFDRIADFLKFHPEIILHLQESESSDLFSHLNEEKNSIIFARTFAANEKDFEQIITEQDQFVAILPADHPLAERKEIHLSALEQENFLMLGKETNLFEPLLALCQEAGFTPTITHEGRRIDLILNMVSRKLGVAILMKKTVSKLLTPNLAAVPVVPNRTSQLSFIRRKGNNTKASNIFWNYLLDSHY